MNTSFSCFEYDILFVISFIFSYNFKETEMQISTMLPQKQKICCFRKTGGGLVSNFSFFLTTLGIKYANSFSLSQGVVNFLLTSVSFE